MERPEKKKPSRRSLFMNTVMLLLVALVAITAVTYAWFSINDNTRLNAMRMDITTGLSMRIDLDAHDDFEEYTTVLSFQQISARILRDRGVDITRVPLTPVTTAEGRTFMFENGSAASANDGNYLDFTLHFKAIGDMYVHLTSTPSKGNADGTRVWSNSQPTLPEAMRISYTMPDGHTLIYDPGADNIAGLTDSNMMFFLPKDTDIPVQVRIWIEGTDPSCNNTLKGCDYSIQMRFEGSDENNQPLT